MASLELDTNKLVMRKKVALAGSDFEVDTPVEVSISGPNDNLIEATLTADSNGAFSGLSFVINAEGTWSISADDGTNTEEIGFRASSSA